MLLYNTRHDLLTFLIVVALSPVIILAVESETKIQSLSLYSDARGCVQGCANSATRYGINSFGCHQKYPATCICSDNVGQSSSIASFANSCALKSCSNAIDASSAVAIWVEYCLVNIVGAAAVVTTAPTTAVVTTVPTTTSEEDIEGEITSSLLISI